MGAIGSLVNLQDISRMLDPKDQIANVIDVLATGNQILDDIVKTIRWLNNLYSVHW